MVLYSCGPRAVRVYSGIQLVYKCAHTFLELTYFLGVMCARVTCICGCQKLKGSQRIFYLFERSRERKKALAEETDVKSLTKNMEQARLEPEPERKAQEGDADTRTKGEQLEHGFHQTSCGSKQLAVTLQHSLEHEDKDEPIWSKMRLLGQQMRQRMRPCRRKRMGERQESFV